MVQPTLAVGLADGVGEIDTAALFDVYSYASAARLILVSTGSSITTAHGVVLLTTPQPQLASEPAGWSCPGHPPTRTWRPRFATWRHVRTFGSRP